MNDPVLIVDSLHCSYSRRGWGWSRREPPVHAVAGVDLQLQAGEIHGLAGESGSGKSSLAKALVGLVPIQAGQVRFPTAEEPGGVHAGTDPRRLVQLVFQDPSAALSPRRTVAQTLREAARHFGLPSDRQRLVEALDDVGLDASALDRLPRQFSSGQRQRIALARALICEPRVLVADEPLASLDVSVQARILELLRALRDERKLAILLISHDLAVLRENADQVSVMYRGRCVESGPVDAVFGHPAHPYTRQLIRALPRLRQPRTDAAAPGFPFPGIAPRAMETGCAFRQRCPEALPRCSREAPCPVVVLGDADHHVECFLHGDS
ncbi:MAG: ABC transporter ATP-binding protein [Xanthomonadales bacterium]|nr:ABC transporter ATP-binding protein [Xanthomonadales bacterium]